MVRRVEISSSASSRGAVEVAELDDVVTFSGGLPVFSIKLTGVFFDLSEVGLILFFEAPPGSTTAEVDSPPVASGTTATFRMGDEKPTFRISEHVNSRYARKKLAR